MISPGKTADTRPAKTGAIWLIGGFVAALLVASVEALRAGGRQLDLAVCGVSALAAVAAGWAIVASIWSWVSRRSGPVRASLFAALVLSPLWYLCVNALSSGPKARIYLGSLRIQLAISAIFVVGTAVAILSVARLWRSRRRLVLVVGFVTCFIVAAIAYDLDVTRYRRLYPAAHWTLLAVYMALLQVALSLAVARLFPRRWIVRMAWAVVALWIGSGVLATYKLRSDGELRYLAVERTTTLSRLIGVLPNALPPIHELQARDEPATVRDRGAQVGAIWSGANVVLITIDALRPDHLGVYGYHRPTSPAIDRFAKSAMRFDAAYTAVPLTCFSIPSLMTGDYLRSTLAQYATPPPTIADLAKRSGYLTAAFFNESIFFCDDKRAKAYGARRFGFTYAETKLRDAQRLTDRVIHYIESRARKQKKPVFLWVHYFDVHEPYRSRPGPQFGSRDIDRYDSEIHFVDAAIGRLLTAIRRLDGPTVTFMTADHGEEFGEHGGNYHGSSLHEEQSRIPLLIRGPGVRTGRVGVPVSSVDVAPTLIEGLALNTAPSAKGDSLLPLLLGHGGRGRAAFAEVHTKKMVRQGRWKLIHDYRSAVNQLYDLKTDPQERKNIASVAPEREQQLLALLAGWFKRLAPRRAIDAPEIVRARNGDRSACPDLARLMLDTSQPTRLRREAARLLGQLKDPGTIHALWLAAADDTRAVASAAAISLGELQDKRARGLLPALAADGNVEERARAGIALGRVGDKRAHADLLTGLTQTSWAIQNRAAHYLGYVGAKEAVTPLMSMAKHVHLRGRIALALGRLGHRHPDPRILPYLVGLAERDPQLDVRTRALVGIAALNQPSAIPHLMALLARGSEAPELFEALERLGAVGKTLSGTPFGPRQIGQGWTQCRRSTAESVTDFVGATTCKMAGPQASVQIAPAGPVGRRLSVRVRSSVAQEVGVWIAGKQVGAIKVGSGWHRHVLSVAQPPRRTQIAFRTARGGVEFDHVIWLR